MKPFRRSCDLYPIYRAETVLGEIDVPNYRRHEAILFQRYL